MAKDPYQRPMNLAESERLLRDADNQKYFWQNIGADVYAIVVLVAAVAALGIFFLGISAIVGTTGAVVVAALYYLVRSHFKGS